MTTTVYLPCKVVAVRAKVVFGDTLSPIESQILRFVGGVGPKGEQVDAVRGVNALSELLGLGDRLTMDIVFDLWRAGHLLIDFAQSAIEVAPDVLRHLHQGTLDQLATAEVADESFEVMIDQLTGHVMIANRLRRAPDTRLAVLEENGTFGPGDISQDALLRALVSIPANEDEPGRRRRVVSAYLPPPQLRGAVDTRWLPVDIKLGSDEASGRLRVTVVERNLPLANREAIAGYIADVVEHAPQSRFGGAVRSAAEIEYVDPPPADEILQRIERLAAEAGGVPVGTLHQRHEQLKEAAKSVREMLGHRVVTEVGARPVSGAEHDALIGDLIAGAERQILIVSSRVTFEGLKPHLATLRRKSLDGVQLVIVWGERFGASLDDRARNFLEDLVRRSDRAPSSRIVWADQSSRTSAALVVADDRRALVCGTSPLAVPPEGQQRLGVLIEAPERRWCDVIEKLLGWARREIPDFRMGQAVLASYGRFGHAEPAIPYEEIAVTYPRKLPATADEPASAGVRTWSDAWLEVAAQLRAGLGARTCSADLVANAQHRDLLWRGLRHASRRVVIASPEIYSGVFDGPLAKQIEALLKAGVAVTLHYGRTLGSPDPRGTIERWRREYPALMRATAIDTSCSALVVDDEAVVGGFDYLGRASEAKPFRINWRSHVSVRLTGAQPADAIAAAFGAPALPRVEQPPAPPVSGPAGVANRMFHQLGLVGPDNRPARAAIVRAAVDGADPPAMLIYLLDTAPADVQQIAVAHVLTRADIDPDEHRKWLVWLLRRLWEDGGFVEAAILREALDEDVRPRRELTALAAARGTPAFGDAVTRALAYCEETGEGTAIAACVLAEVVSDRPDLVDGAQLLAEFEENSARYDLGTAWEAVLDACGTYWNQVGVRLPWPEIQADLDRDRHRAEEALAWSELRKAFNRAAQIGFRHLLGIRLQGKVFAPDGLFGVLDPAIEERDARAVRAWLDRREIHDLGRTIDEMANEIWSRGPLHSDQRANYLQRLGDVRAAAAAVADRTVDGSGRRGQMEHTRSVGRALASAWPDLQAAVREIGVVERVLGARALADVQRLADWGREHGEDE